VYDRVKRTLDIILAASGLLILWPVLALVAVAIRLHMGAPVLFRQVRPGFKGQPFTLLKFRTLTEVRDTRGHYLPDAERLTPLGRWLRRSSLDELPELWNVLRGEMSLVGPRPLLMQYLERYTPAQARRHEVKPGITGWAQVNGRNALTWQQKFQLDLWYVDRHSFALDLKILARTICQTLSRKGISHEGHVSMAEFTGSIEEQ
jgi:lipopolysaccharide/colanic/teichoic acid biosynthesis glycosyltransferase